MKIKIKQLTQYTISTFEKIIEQKAIDIAKIYYLVKAIKDIQEVITNYDKSRVLLIKKYMKKGEKIENNQVVIENAEEFNEQIEILNDIEIELNLPFIFIEDVVEILNCNELQTLNLLGILVSKKVGE